jgi:hypothetical protein
MPQVVPELSSQIAENRNVIAGLARRLQGASDTLYPPFTVGNCAVGFAPARRGWQHYVSPFGGGRQKNILHHQML